MLDGKGIVLFFKDVELDGLCLERFLQGFDLFVLLLKEGFELG